MSINHPVEFPPSLTGQLPASPVIELGGTVRRAYWDFTHGWDDMQSLPIASEVERLSRNVPGGSRIADVGCGSGRNTEFLLNSGHQVLANDISTRALARIAGNDKLEKHQCSAADLPYETQSVQAAVMWRVLHNLPEQEANRAVAELFRILEPGGKLLLSVAAAEGKSAFLRSVEGWVALRRFYWQRVLFDVLEDVGFSDITVRKTTEKAAYWHNNYWVAEAKK